MPDSNAVAHPFDAKKINVNDPYEMKQWIKMQKIPQEVRVQPRHKPGPARGAFLILAFTWARPRPCLAAHIPPFNRS